MRVFTYVFTRYPPQFLVIQDIKRTPAMIMRMKALAGSFAIPTDDRVKILRVLREAHAKLLRQSNRKTTVILP
jgi:hypothetical protein